MGSEMCIRDSYAAEGTPLVVLAGKEYGSGSSRDWAAKGTTLLGVRAVIAESYERIHRSNLVGMGVLPLQFPEGESAESLGLTGEEEFSITGIDGGDAKEVQVRAGDEELSAERVHPCSVAHATRRAASAARRAGSPRAGSSAAPWACRSGRAP